MGWGCLPETISFKWILKMTDLYGFYPSVIHYLYGFDPSTKQFQLFFEALAADKTVSVSTKILVVLCREPHVSH